MNLPVTYKPTKLRKKPEEKSDVIYYTVDFLSLSAEATPIFGPCEDINDALEFVPQHYQSVIITEHDNGFDSVLYVWHHRMDLWFLMTDPIRK